MELHSETVTILQNLCNGWIHGVTVTAHPDGKRVILTENDEDWDGETPESRNYLPSEILTDIAEMMREADL